MAKNRISSSDDRDWQAESDCDSLMRAQQVKNDPKRMKAAATVAKKRLEDAATVVSATNTTKEQ